MKNQKADQFQALVAEHLDALYGFALSLTRNKAKAEDLVQESVLKAFRFFHQFERGTHIKAWLFKILKNTFLTDWRRDKRHPESLSMDDEESNFSFYVEAFRQSKASPQDYLPPESLHEQDMEQFFGDEIMKAMESLPMEFREVIFMCDVQGFAYADIAKILNIPIGTVRSRLARGRGMLQKHLWQYAQDRGILKRSA
ncbi:MAG: sigma-70 family RNA polymerase sigma factor [Candidatus Omnitrophica bacterium]|nr:sigma-70 family RNA polymerase sigma factor [Candidatus Omnitrophota bacterium]